MSVVYTVGHSTRSAGELVELLREHGVELLVDVRRWPSSRRHPHFDRDALGATLAEAGIDYRHQEALGGMRDPGPEKESRNDGWRTEGFRAYADHLNTEDGQEAVERLARTGRARTVAVMCAEAVPWRCHRQLVADALVARGLEVRHVVGPGRVEEHELREMARVLDDGRVVYPARQEAGAGEREDEGEEGTGEEEGGVQGELF